MDFPYNPKADDSQCLQLRINELLLSELAAPTFTYCALSRKRRKPKCGIPRQAYSRYDGSFYGVYLGERKPLQAQC